MYSIDEQGYRSNVGIVLLNQHNQVFWAKRIVQEGWQFPQGGVDSGETIEQALYRELNEEVGLTKNDVEVIGETADWVYYKLPKQFIRWRQKPICFGQKQKWFLLRLNTSEDQINLNASEHPEFREWCWVDYWYPIDQVIEFKQDVYREVLKELYAYLPTN